jgi:hypothetical protein
MNPNTNKLILIERYEKQQLKAKCKETEKNKETTEPPQILKLTFAERIADEHKKILTTLINTGHTAEAKNLLSILIKQAINDINY